MTDPESVYRVKPRVMVDLFCGRGGWTKGFQAHGWHCIGIDLNPQPEYPGEFIQADIAQMFELPAADFYCCSSPCENFALFQMRMFHPNPKWPWLGIALFEHARNMILATGKPYIMENVRGAQAFVGRSDAHFGPFYVWGNCLSAGWPFPPELFKLKKGFDLGGSAAVKGMSREEITAYRRKYDPMWSSSKSAARKEATAKGAEIPMPLASHIARMAVNL